MLSESTEINTQQICRKGRGAILYVYCVFTDLFNVEQYYRLPTWLKFDFLSVIEHENGAMCIVNCQNMFTNYDDAVFEYSAQVGKIKPGEPASWVEK